jgi:hypothetical protein
MTRENDLWSTSTAPIEQPLEDSAATAATPRIIRIATPGRFLAGVVLTTALAAVSPGVVADPNTLLVSRRRYESTDAETEVELADPALVAEVGDLFERGADEFFEDGVQSQFSRALLRFIEEHGKGAFTAIARYLYSGDPNPDVVSESLRWLAEIDDPSSLPDRWTILQNMLRDHSPRIRDGAILGFATLDDPRAAPLLANARHLEQITQLRRLIADVLAQLDATAAHAAAPDRRS